MKLAGEEVVLAAPPLIVDAWDVQAAMADGVGRLQILQRVVACALGLCWVAFRSKIGTPRYGGDVLAYGGEVMTFLAARGVTKDQIWEAGGPALKICMESMVTDEHLKAAVGNFGAPAAGGSDSSSESNADGGKSPDGSPPSPPSALPS